MVWRFEEGVVALVTRMLCTMHGIEQTSNDEIGDGQSGLSDIDGFSNGNWDQLIGVTPCGTD